VVHARIGWIGLPVGTLSYTEKFIADAVYMITVVAFDALLSRTVQGIGWVRCGVSSDPDDDTGSGPRN